MTGQIQKSTGLEECIVAPVIVKFSRLSEPQKLVGVSAPKLTTGRPAVEQVPVVDGKEWRVVNTQEQQYKTAGGLWRESHIGLWLQLG